MLLSDRLGVNAATAHPSSRVAQALRAAGVPRSPELLRVLALPRRELDLDGALLRYVVAGQHLAPIDAGPVYARLAGPCGNPDCMYCAQGAPGLKPVQTAMLIEAAACAGGFFHVGVGGGKTLASLLLHDAIGARRTVLLIPPQLRAQLLTDDEPELRAHYHLPPVYAPSRGDAIGADGVYVVAYSELSQTTASDLLDRIAPDLIVADEAHNLRAKDSARTRRFLRYMRQHGARFVAMTGTPIDSSVTDFAHLIELALGAGSPLPASYQDLVAWADAIDHEGEPGHTGPGALTLLCEGDETIRAAFLRRLVQTAGVISTAEPSCDAAIQLSLLQVAPPPVVVAALDTLRAEWAWNGEEFDSELTYRRIAREIVQGLYHRLVWPGQPDREWLDARNAWARAIRQRLTRTNRENLDSPALLEAAARRGEWTPPEWFEWEAIRDRSDPQSEPVELDRWLVGVAQAWAQRGPGIVWVDAPLVGEWLAQAGIPYYGADSDAELLGADPTRTIACSIRAHGTGKKLAAWSRSLILYPPASALILEQLIGRTHRPGQRATTVEIDILLASPEAEAALESARAKARLIDETTLQPQKLLSATNVDRELDYLS